MLEPPPAPEPSAEAQAPQPPRRADLIFDEFVPGTTPVAFTSRMFDDALGSFSDAALWFDRPILRSRHRKPRTRRERRRWRARR